MANKTAGTAYIKILPDMTGIKGSLQSALEEEAASAGSTAGKTASQSLGSALSSASSTMSAAASALSPITELGKTILTTGMEFDKSMSNVQAISGATGEELEQLRDKAKEMGANTKFSASEAADAMGYMAMAGWEAEDMLNGISGIMSLAAASGEDLATTSDIVTDALTAFGMGAEESGRLADIMAAAASSANTNVSMMGETFKYAASLSGALTFSAEDVAVALGLMANSGIKSSQAGTALKNVMLRLADPTDEVAYAMDKLGIELDDGEGNMHSFREIMDQMREGLGSLEYDQEAYNRGLEELNRALENGEITEKSYEEALESLADCTLKSADAQKAQYASMLAGSYGLSGLLAIVSASDEDYEALCNAIDHSSDAMVLATDGSVIPLSEALEKGIEYTKEYTGTAEAMADVMQNNLSGDMDTLASKTEGLYIELSEKIMPIARDVLEKVIDLVDWLSSLDDGTKNVILAVGGFLAVASPLLGAIGNISSGISSIVSLGPSLATAFSNAGAAAAGAASQTSAFGLELGKAGTAALAAADAALVFYDVKKLNEAAETYQQAADAHQNEIDASLGNYKKLYEEKGKEIADQWAEMVYGIDLTNANFDQAQEIITGKIEGYWADVPENMWDGFDQGWNYYFGENGAGLGSLIVDGFSGMVDSVKGFLGIHSPSTVMEEIGENTSSGFLNGMDSGWPGILAGMQEYGSGILASFSSLPDTLTGVGANIMNGLWNGLQTAGSTVASGVVGIASGIAGAFTSFFGIASPSKLFAEYGGYMMEGVAEGIRDNADAPISELAGAGDDMAAAMARNMSGGNALPQGFGFQEGGSGSQGRDAGKGNGAGGITVILELDRAELGRAVFDLNAEEEQRRGTKIVWGNVR